MKTHLLSTARLPSSLATALAALISAQSVQAVDFFWDPAASGTNAGSGSGTWNAGEANWFDGTNKVWANANRPVFGGVAGPFLVTVADNFSTTGLLFNRTGYTLGAASAQTITKTAGDTTLASGVTATIGSNVTVTRNGNDIITGTGGILNIGGADQLSTGAQYVNSQAGNTGGRTLSITAGATVNVNSGGYFGQSAATTYTATNVNGTTIGVGINASGGSLVVKSGGIVTAGNNTHVVVGLGTSASGTLTIDGGEVNGGAITNTSNTPGPSGPQSPVNYGGLRFGSNNSLSGTRIVNLNGGNLNVGQVFIQGTTGTATNTFNFNGGTLKATIENTTFMTGLTAANVQAGGAKIDSNNFDITIGQALIHDAALGATVDGGLTKSSAGTLTLTSSATFTGDTTISGGTLKLSGASGKLGGSSYAGAMSIASGATFENASSGSQTLGGAITGGGTLTNSGGGGLLLTNAGNSFGALSISNAGSRVFINHATALPTAATVNIASGALVFSASATSASAITVSSGGTLTARAATTLSNVTLPGSGSVTFNNDDANTNSLTINNGQTLTDNLTVQVGGARMLATGGSIGAVDLSGNITGGGSLVMTSSGNISNPNNQTGKLTLSGTNTYTGATTVNSGTLFVTGSLTSDVSVSDAAMFGGGGTVGAVSFAGGSYFDIALAVGGNPLDSTTTISFASTGFGIENLRYNGVAVDWSTIGDNTYTLISGDLSETNLSNFGLANAYDIGGGRSAYFTEGSLQLVVIPEPHAALLGGLGLLALLRRRRA